MSKKAVVFGKYHISLRSIIGDFRSRFNMVQNGGRAFNTTDLDAGGTAVWGAENTATSAPSYLAPDGSLTGGKLTETVNTFNNFRLGSRNNLPSYNFGAAPQTGIPFECWLIAKKVERTRFVLVFNSGGGFECSAGFDLAGGNTGYSNQVLAGWAGLASSMTSLGDDWWLCKMEAYLTEATAGGFGWQITLDNGSGTAARSIAYNGTIGSGILLWYMNVLPKSAVSLTNQVFFDDFNDLSTIDVNDTGAPGFNWYPHNTWPDGPGNLATANVSPSNTFSVADSILTISKGSNSFNLDLSSARVDPMDSGDFIGTVYEAPFMVEYRLTWDPVVAAATTNYRDTNTTGWNGGWPAFWSLDVDSLIGNSLTISGYADQPRAGEVDVGDGPFDNEVPCLHFTTNVIDYHALVGVDFASITSPLNPTAIDDFHTITWLMMPYVGANNNGYIMFFRDGICTISLFRQIPAIGGGLAYSDFNSFRWPLFLSGASGFMEPGHTPADTPLLVDWIRVTQT